MSVEYSVQIRNGAVLHGARLSGRLEQFPRIRTKQDGIEVDVEVSWQVAQRLAESKAPLIL
jgi:hypothetical protein